MKSLKEKLRERKVTIGSWITIGNCSVAEIMAKSSFDWLTIDMEHSSITMSEAQDLIRVIDLSGGVPLVRVGSNDPYLIKRVMDSGAHGVIVPMVNSKDEAINAVNAVKYPPLGVRGVGLARAQGYGQSFEGYKKWLEESSVIIVQIEHIKAVDNLEEILSVAGIDGFIIGPYDLSGSLGVPGNFEHPDVIKALDKVKKISLKLNANSGFHVIAPDIEKVNEKIREGYKFIAFSLDTLFFSEAIKSIKQAIF
jgi:2-keto-3-deoxy-L-rhamnonate aldolase RhmA